MTADNESQLTGALKLREVLLDEIEDRKSQVTITKSCIGIGVAGVIGLFIGNAIVGGICIAIGAISIPAYYILKSKLDALIIRGDNLNTMISALSRFKRPADL